MNIPSLSILLLLFSLIFIEMGRRKNNIVISRIGGVMAATALLAYIVVYLAFIK